MATAVESRRAVESAERATYAGHLLDNCFCGSGGSKVEQRVGVYVCVCVSVREYGNAEISAVCLPGERLCGSSFPAQGGAFTPAPLPKVGKLKLKKKTARAPSNRTNMLIYARTHICTGFYGPSASVCVCAVDVAAFCGCVCERECAARVYYQPLKNTLFFAERTEF